MTHVGFSSSTMRRASQRSEALQKFRGSPFGFHVFLVSSCFFHVFPFTGVTP